ncbi:Calcium/calmodulin-dependent protein kinase kinase cmkC [Cladobotryum mycophilum]|uniref:Calcium/calmodulin-dependent protein kinase kinase cmkC n=1 Tax=Cladobotryum mycophilum TaxID=491253 RepID=A0ABR0SDN9_9HYPO
MSANIGEAAATTPPDSPLKTAPARLQSPKVILSNQDDEVLSHDSRQPLHSTSSEPTTLLHGYASPLRQHKRTPSAHREIKETLDARVEFTNDETDGRTHHRINQYVIMEEIGRGSYGAVHRATDQFGNEFAVKEFSKTRLRRRAQSQAMRQGPLGPRRLPGRGGPLTPQLNGLRTSEKNDALFFIREEIAIMKKLNHPNLAQLIEVLDDPEEDSLYIVMEMCKKGVIMKVGLDEKATPYTDEECRFWFRDLILGIEYLHAQGVIHRDIKPDNLLLSDDDVLKVVDFGVSEMFEKTKNMRTAKSAGSPAFLPPELCGKHTEVSGTAADIWSMGVTLYCLKYGSIPFNGSGILEIYEAIKSEDVKIPDDETTHFSDVITRLLNKNPDTRITMRELRQHSWVTKCGTDTLLSAEENCAHLIEPPNELELNHAFTKKMNHLLCVMKAIHRLKSRVARRRKNKRMSESTSGAESTSLLPSSFDTMRERARLVDIATLITKQKNMLATADGNELLKGHAHDVSDQEPLFLGIGTGARNDFVRDEPTPDVVSDSPTAVDYDVYDRAYEEAINQRVKATQPVMYLNKLVGGKDYFKNMENLVDETSISPPPMQAQGEGSETQSLGHVSPPPLESKLAQLVAKVGVSDAQGHKNEAEVQN